MTELFNYSTSWLNPGLKLLIAALYIIVAIVYFRSSRVYEGELYIALSVLFWMATVAALASLFRYFGHGTMFGFSKEFSLKWFQSFGYVVQATLLVIAGWLFTKGIVPEMRD